MAYVTHKIKEGRPISGVNWCCLLKVIHCLVMMSVCTAVSLMNESCSPEWKITVNYIAHGNKEIHWTARSLERCQQACVFNPGCFAVLWPLCYLFTSLTGTGLRRNGYIVYELVKRCNVTPGLLFYHIFNTLFVDCDCYQWISSMQTFSQRVLRP